MRRYCYITGCQLIRKSEWIAAAPNTHNTERANNHHVHRDLAGIRYRMLARWERWHTKCVVDYR
jgi:hypothetical protein